jgi:hypothetical protein
MSADGGRFPILASLAISVVAGIYLYDAKKFLNEKQRELKKLVSELKQVKITQGVEIGNDKGADKKLDEPGKELEGTAKELETLKKELEQREEMLSIREMAVSMRELKFEEAAVPDELEQREEMLSIREMAVSQRELKFEDAAVPDVVPAEDDSEADAPAVEEKPKKSEGEKRQKMIEEELAKIVEGAEDELEEELEPEALKVLQKAAYKICYLKKYYDVVKDEVILFPSVTNCFVNGTLIEEAEKYWYDEDDEFPMDYSAALRCTATESMAPEDEDQDDDYMLKLAMDVEI